MSSFAHTRAHRKKKARLAYASDTRNISADQALAMITDAKLIPEEISKIEQQVKSLVLTRISVSQTFFMVKPMLVVCMADGKACSALSCYSSPQACFLCGATPKDMNKPKAASIFRSSYIASKHIPKGTKEALTRDVLSLLTIPSLKNNDHNDFRDSEDDGELPDSDTSKNHSDIVDINYESG
ncbi:hypothetical protein ILUMI_06712 [Ignelater luminosus]|uniref:Uncharacterized protein n=1 Tax=Ignelater luminosus TaxID=2038154 RepID=A0A8K0D9E9_IGNLU|nr:hypothetical protein ILUMI_06712 [Ignelater luminosus]